VFPVLVLISTVKSRPAGLVLRGTVSGQECSSTNCKIWCLQGRGNEEKLGFTNIGNVYPSRDACPLYFLLSNCQFKQKNRKI